MLLCLAVTWVAHATYSHISKSDAGTTSQQFYATVYGLHYTEVKAPIIGGAATWVVVNGQPRGYCSETNGKCSGSACILSNGQVYTHYLGVYNYASGTAEGLVTDSEALHLQNCPDEEED